MSDAHHISQPKQRIQFNSILFFHVFLYIRSIDFKIECISICFQFKFVLFLLLNG